MNGEEVLPCYSSKHQETEKAMRNNHIPYHKVVAARLARSKERYATARTNKYLEVDRFMQSYEQAYQEYYGVPITLAYKRGWYYIAGARYRHSMLEEMTKRLLARIQEAQCVNPDNEERKDG